MKLYNLNTYIYIFLKILLIINDISNLIQIREKQIIKQIILSTNSIFFFQKFYKIARKNHKLSMLSYQHVLPFIVCNVSAKKEKSGSRHNSVYTTKREQSVSQYIYTEELYAGCEDERERQRCEHEGATKRIAFAKLIHAYHRRQPQKVECKQACDESGSLTPALDINDPVFEFFDEYRI